MQVLFEFVETGEIEISEIRIELKAYKKIIDDMEIKLILGRPEGTRCYCIYSSWSRRNRESRLGANAFSNV